MSLIDEESLERSFHFEWRFVDIFLFDSLFLVGFSSLSELDNYFHCCAIMESSSCLSTSAVTIRWTLEVIRFINVSYSKTVSVIFFARASIGINSFTIAL